MVRSRPPRRAGLTLVACGVLLAVLRPPAIARAQASRTLIIVAHQDDDFAAAAEVAPRIAAGDPVRVLYMTSGDAAEGCGDYVRSREQGVKDVYAHLAGLPKAPDCGEPGQSGCWSETERLYGDARVRMLGLQGSSVSLGFYGFFNPAAENDRAYLEPTLERLWAVPGASVETLALDGRSRTDVYSKQALIESLRAQLEELAPTHVMTMDPNRQQLLFWPFEHTDHVHTALFVFAALQRWGQPVELTMERGYSTMFLPANRAPAEVQASQTLVDIYLPYDGKICEGGTTELCEQEVACFEPSFFDLQKRHYYTTHAETGMRRRITTSAGMCLDVWGSWVFAAPCLFFSGSQRWNLLDDGRIIQHAASRKCLAADGRAGVSLAACDGAPAQRFSLLDNGALLGPDARCVTATGSFVELLECALDPRQTGFCAH